MAKEKKFRDEKFVESNILTGYRNHAQVQNPPAIFFPVPRYMFMPKIYGGKKEVLSKKEESKSYLKKRDNDCSFQES